MIMQIFYKVFIYNVYSFYLILMKMTKMGFSVVVIIIITIIIMITTTKTNLFTVIIIIYLQFQVICN